MNGSDIHLQLQSARRILLSTKSQESLMEFSRNASLKIKFEALPLPDNRIYIPNEYAELSRVVIDWHMRERTSAMTAIKSNHCKRLQLESGNDPPQDEEPSHRYDDQSFPLGKYN
jgi:hypothetical protein